MTAPTTQRYFQGIKSSKNINKYADWLQPPIPNNHPFASPLLLPPPPHSTLCPLLSPPSLLQLASFPFPLSPLPYPLLPSKLPFSPLPYLLHPSKLPSTEWSPSPHQWWCDEWRQTVGRCHGCVPGCCRSHAENGSRQSRMISRCGQWCPPAGDRMNN